MKTELNLNRNQTLQQHLQELRHASRVAARNGDYRRVLTLTHEVQRLAASANNFEAANLQQQLEEN